MKKVISAIIIYASATTFYAQPDTIIKYPLQDSASSNISSLILGTDSGELLYFTHEKDSINLSRSNDKGISWYGRHSLFPASETETNILAGIQLEDGKILITYRRDYPVSNYYRFSDDNGATWSDPISSVQGSITESSYKQTHDGRIWFIYTSSGTLRYQVSADNGESWGVPRVLWLQSLGGDLVSIDDSTLFVVGVIRQEFRNDFDLFGRFSYDNGSTWEEPFEIVSSETHEMRPRIVRKDDGTLELIYIKYNFNSDLWEHSSNILTIKSEDNGVTWSEPSYFASYFGYNGDHNVVLDEGRTYITFSTDRFDSRQIWYGVSDFSDDVKTPPYIYEQSIIPGNPLPQEPVTFSVKVLEDNGIRAVMLHHSINGAEVEPQVMHDDGLHNDGLENDGTFGFLRNGFLPGDTVIHYISAEDINSNTSATNPDTLIIPPANNYKTCLIDVNNVLLPLENNGTIADAKVLFPDNIIKSQGRFDGHNFLYSGGFGLSGYTNGSLWGNGQMTASRMENYLPGTVSPENDTLDFNLYLLKTNVPPFSSSWQDWKKAVALGADFYDGDNDGVYNPVDLNGNGEWDDNEDRPDLLGDITAWCVFNDGVPAEDRIFQNVNPQGIEIRQSVFAYSKDIYPELANVIFIRYKIKNTGSVAQVLESVYFSAWADADMGDYNDDLVGCDKKTGSGYLYNDSLDQDYGINAPAFFITLLEGPPAYIPGITYTDYNNNGKFDSWLDEALDTAIIRRGELLGRDLLPGAANLKIQSFVEYLKSHPTQGDPDNEEQLRYNMLGRNQAGVFIDPCEWVFGIVENDDCSTIDPRFMYSGDPVNRTGWINTFPSDKRLTLSTGPFRLEADKPVEILLAYTLGRGSDNLNSITVGKEIVKDVIRFYETNFSDYTVDVDNKSAESIPSKFHLSQNYPNPFNPATTIEYSIPADSRQKTVGSGQMAEDRKQNWGKNAQSSNHSIRQSGDWRYNVSLKIYDILGREVSTLVDKPQAPGNYKVQWNAVSLASGVYFYTLKYGSFIQSKKMILLK